MSRQRLVEGQHVVRNHSQANDQRTAGGALVKGSRQRLDQVRGDVEGLRPVAIREPDLIGVLEVSQPSMNQTRGPAGRHPKVPFQHEYL